MQMVLRRSHLQGSKGSNRSNYQSDGWHRVHGSMPLRRGTWLLSDRKQSAAPHPPSLHRSKEPLDRREQRAKLYWRRKTKSSICVHDGEPPSELRAPLNPTPPELRRIEPCPGSTTGPGPTPARTPGLASDGPGGARPEVKRNADLYIGRVGYTSSGRFDDLIDEVAV